EREVEFAGGDEVGEADSRAAVLVAVLGPHHAAIGDEIVGIDVKPLRSECDERRARGGGRAPDLHAAALNAIRSGGSSLIGRERGIALDIFDLIDADAELLAGYLAHSDAKSLAEIDFAAIQRHRAVAIDGKECVHCVRVDRSRASDATRTRRAWPAGKGKTDREHAARQNFAARQTCTAYGALPRDVHTHISLPARRRPSARV